MPLRVHQDIVLTSQMFVDGDDVILLPAATRYEQEGGGTSTTTERQIAFSPQVADPLGEARSEWRIFAELATRVRPELADRFAWADNRAPARRDRRRSCRCTPASRTSREVGDAVQYGGRHLCAGGAFPTPSRAGPVLRARRRPDRARPGRVVRVDAAGQAVQLDGPRRRPTRSPAPAATRSTSTATTPACSASPTATRVTLTQRRRAVRRAGQARAPADADAAGALAGGQRAAAGRAAHREPHEPDPRLQRRRHRASVAARGRLVKRRRSDRRSARRRRVRVLLFVVARAQLARRGQRRARRSLDVAAPFLIGLAVGWLLSPNAAPRPCRVRRRRRRLAGDGRRSASCCAGSRGTAARRCRSSSSPRSFLGLLHARVAGGRRRHVASPARGTLRAAAVGGGTLRRRNRHQPVRGQPALFDHF